MTLSRFLTRHALRASVVLLAVHGLAFGLTSWVRAQRGMDAPGTASSAQAIAGSWLRYLGGVLGGDLGMIPYAQARPVAQVVGEAWPRSVLLLVVALTVATLAGVVLALIALDPRHERGRPLAYLASVVGFSVPGFYLGILLLEGSLQLSRLVGRPGEPFLPSGGFGWGMHLVLPTLALAVRPAAEVARLLAELMEQELEREYMRMARAKGRSRRAALLRHALPNVAATAAVAIGSSLRYVISSLIVVELLFGWQGLGMRLAQALTPRVDGRPSEAMLLHPETVAALLTVFAALYLIAGALSDGAALAFDPRQRRAARPHAATSRAAPRGGA